MGKSLYIAEKPSVARQFADVLANGGERDMRSRDGYIEGENTVVTWCVGHLVSMSYPEVYDEKYKSWRFDTLPFLPKEFKYEIIPSAAKQYRIVAALLCRDDVETIYVCTDSGREGEYIYRLVRQMAGVEAKQKDERRVWIDSQTEEEILRGIKEAKPLSAYDTLSDSAYLRAKEDYLMGINFSRVLSLRYGRTMADFMHKKFCSISVGRVMTCVQGMVVSREREIRNFVKTPFYRVLGGLAIAGDGSFGSAEGGSLGLSDGASAYAAECVVTLPMEWKAVSGSRYFESPKLYKENGFKERTDAEELIQFLAGENPVDLSDKTDSKYDINIAGVIEKVERKKEKKQAPLLYNLAEAQNDCAKFFKISPDETLKIIQELYEKKLVTYPRTDARVLSTAVAKEIDKNIRGLMQLSGVKAVVAEILDGGLYKGLAKTRYVNDKQITDHYAIIPTGQGLRNLGGCSKQVMKVYELIVRRFLAIFLPPAVYEKLSLVVRADGGAADSGNVTGTGSLATASNGNGGATGDVVNAGDTRFTERFFASEKYLVDEGYLRVMDYSFRKKNGAGEMSGADGGDAAGADGETDGRNGNEENGDGEQNAIEPEKFKEIMSSFKKNDTVRFANFSIKEGETSPPKRYNSGSLILAMENAGKLIEDEELRAQIKTSGIGTSATRAEILDKLIRKEYLSLNKKTQIITPTLEGEMLYDIVRYSIAALLKTELTASWEKGLNQVYNGDITTEVYMEKLESFVRKHTERVKTTNNAYGMQNLFREAAKYYDTTAAGKTKAGSAKSGNSTGRKKG